MARIFEIWKPVKKDSKKHKEKIQKTFGWKDFYQVYTGKLSVVEPYKMTLITLLH